jgi:hypothetical protein
MATKTKSSKLTTVTCEVYRPKDKLPQPSDAMHTYEVLILVRDKYRKPNLQWHKGMYFGGLLKEWRVSGQNPEVHVVAWTELPTTKPFKVTFNGESNGRG